MFDLITSSLRMVTFIYTCDKLCIMGESKKEDVASESEFIHFLTENRGKKNLVNDHDRPLSEMIHPLMYSSDPKNSPSMCAIPSFYKMGRSMSSIYKMIRK